MNILNNLSPFYIGQKVVYITGIYHPKNTIYTIKDIIKYPCGCYGIDIGEKDTYGISICGDHNSYLNTPSNIAYYDSNSFRPLQELKFPLISYSKVLEEQLVGSN